MSEKQKRQLNSRRRLAALAFLAGVLVTVLVLALGIELFHIGSFVSTRKMNHYQALEEDFGKYYEIHHDLETKSIYKMDRKALDQSMIQALLGSVDDKYAVYYTPEEYENLQRRYTQGYTGVGISVMQDEDRNLVVHHVIKGGSAEENGILEGDIIVSIDGHSPKNVEEASKWIQGESGTSVTVTLNRGGQEVTVELIRTEVEVESVDYEAYTGEVGYIQIQAFREGTTDEFRDAVKALTDEGYTKIIIDLRGNTGGIMKEGVDAVDELLPACKIMTAKNSKGKETVYNSDAHCAEFDYVVLVNGDTASAAEIFAGAVQQNKGGKLIGTKTYGKGLIQSIYKFDDGSALRLTTEEYFLPNGTAINGKGIQPDIEASGDAVMDEALRALS